MPILIDSLYSDLERHNLRARVVSVDRLDDLRREIQDRHAQGQFDPEFFRGRLDWFDFAPPADLPGAASVIVVANAETALLISGTGDVVEPDDGIIAIGSGGPYALAAARALVKHTDLGARAVAEEALGIAAGICVYTNREMTVEEL